MNLKSSEGLSQKRSVRNGGVYFTTSSWRKGQCLYLMPLPHPVLPRHNGSFSSSKWAHSFLLRLLALTLFIYLLNDSYHSFLSVSSNLMSFEPSLVFQYKNAIIYCIAHNKIDILIICTTINVYFFVCLFISCVPPLESKFCEGRDFYLFTPYPQYLRQCPALK